MISSVVQSWSTFHSLILADSRVRPDLNFVPWGYLEICPILRKYLRYGAYLLLLCSVFFLFFFVFSLVVFFFLFSFSNVSLFFLSVPSVCPIVDDILVDPPYCFFHISLCWIWRQRRFQGCWVSAMLDRYPESLKYWSTEFWALFDQNCFFHLLFSVFSVTRKMACSNVSNVAERYSCMITNVVYRRYERTLPSYKFSMFFFSSNASKAGSPHHMLSITRFIND